MDGWMMLVVYFTLLYQSVQPLHRKHLAFPSLLNEISIPFSPALQHIPAAEPSKIPEELPTHLTYETV